MFNSGLYQELFSILENRITDGNTVSSHKYNIPTSVAFELPNSLEFDPQVQTMDYFIMSSRIVMPQYLYAETHVILCKLFFSLLKSYNQSMY